MSNIKLTVTPEEVGMRVDKFLSTHLLEFSRRHLQLLIKEGALIIDNAIVTEADYKLRLGNVCTFTLKQITHAPFKIKPKEMQLDIVFEDEHLLVVNKPAGLTVHPGAGNHDDTLINGLVAYCGTNLPEYGKSKRLGLVHRLDRDTTGLLLVAKTETALYKLSKALARREIKRHYLALAYGKITTRCGRIETFIARHPHDRTRMAVNHDDGKLAITNYSLQKHFDGNLSLIECQLETGRTHQIRVHMAHLQHPIVGDKSYGRHLNFNLSSLPETTQEALRQFPRQALHAYKLEFAHPASEQIITLQISLAKDISDLLELLSLKQVLMREENKKLKILSRRAFVLGLFKGSIFAGLIARYYYLQVLESEHYSLLSDKNRIHIDLTPPIRGNILSADGKVIAGNRSSHQLVVQIRKIKELDGIARRLGEIMRNPNYLDSTVLARAKANFLPNHYITIKNDLTWEEIARLSGAAYNIPEVLIIDASMRYYPYGAITAHISGYVASLNAKEQEKHQDMRGFNAKVGKNGAEKQYQDSLQGKPGIDKVEVNVLGSKIRNIASQPSIKGADVCLSLNMELQLFVHEALASRQGSVVVMDIESGKIIAMQSTPSYDPNLFVNGISNADWQQLISNPNSPLINKAISFTYPPGSTFKPISALTLLSAGVDPAQKVLCNGEYVVGNRTFHCWKWKYGGHGAVDLGKSISASCNVYYYSMASRIGINKLHKVASMLGMGACTGIELPFEVCGLMPSKQWKAQRLNAPWTAGDTVNSIIGQGYNSATILQLAVMVARIASGTAIKPTILNQEKAKPAILDIDEASLSLVRKGMYNSLNSPEGTGYNYRLPYDDFALAGKTGTAQIASLSENNKLEDHGLFIGFAPFHQPRFAIATIVEHGKWGSQSAAPLSAGIMRFIKENLNLF